MDAGRLRELVEDLYADEQETEVQQKLSELRRALAAFASAPQEPQRQIEVAERLAELEAHVDKLASNYDPARARLLESIGALPYFSQDMVKDIRRVMDDSPMMPAVVQKYVDDLVKKRAEFLQTLQAASTTLNALGVQLPELTEGAAEIGFEIPRELFQNNLAGLVKELHVINRIIRAFAELGGRTPEPIVVQQISTTDPIFTFLLEPETIAIISIAITWALNTWKQLEEIRLLRAQTAKVEIFTTEEIEQFYDSKIQKTLEKAVAEKVDDMLKAEKGKAGRINEQRTHLKWALESIFARIERGMTVEIRMIPPPPPKEGEDSRETAKVAAFKTMQEIIPQLVFPEPDQNPILALPEPPDEKAPAAPKKRD